MSDAMKRGIYVWYISRGCPMAQTAKLFMNGRSQAVRLPAEFRFSGREVFIERQGDAVVLRPKPAGWDDFFGRPSQVPPDYLAGRQDLEPEQRDLF
jgi:antitoxin VapB